MRQSGGSLAERIEVSGRDLRKVRRRLEGSTGQLSENRVLLAGMIRA